jgi:hypothetical protein
VAENTERLEMEVVLDPEGFRSQLTQLKQEIGLSLQGASYSAGMTAGALGTGFNSPGRDIGALASAVMFQPTPVQDLGSNPASMISGLVPSLTAPRSYDVEEWGRLQRDSLFKSLADVGVRATMAAPGVIAGQVGFGFGMGAGGAALGFMGSGILGGFAGAAAAGYAVNAVMDPIQARYASGKAIGAMGGRFGISATNEVLDGITEAQASFGLTGAETTGILRTGLEQGVFGQVGSSDEFNQKFRALMRGAKEVSTTLHTELADSVRVIGQLQNQGFGDIQGAVGAVRAARVTSQMTGINASEALALAQAGAGMTVGNLGMSAQYGAQSTLGAYEAITHGLREKTVDQEAINQLGGRARAAQAMTMSGLGYLESPMGRATLLGAYDASTGQLDPTKFMVEPGAAFNQAMTNVFSGANPMKTLLEFAGNRQRVASSASPEEVALAQASTWASLARQIDPKGPITQDMLVGAATVMGTNADVARTIVGSIADPGALQERQRALMDQAAKASTEQAGTRGGMFGGAFAQGIGNALSRYGSKLYYGNFGGHLVGAPGAPGTMMRLPSLRPASLVAGASATVGGMADIFATPARMISEAVYGRQRLSPQFTQEGLLSSLPDGSGNSVSADIFATKTGFTQAEMDHQESELLEALGQDYVAGTSRSSLSYRDVSAQRTKAATIAATYLPQFASSPKGEALDLLVQQATDEAEASLTAKGAEAFRDSLIPQLRRLATTGGRSGGYTAKYLRDSKGGDFLSMSARRDVAAAGLRFITGMSGGARDLALARSGVQADTALRGIASELMKGSEGKTDLAKLPALADMRTDIDRLKDLGLNSGGGVALTDIASNFDMKGLRRTELEQAAGADKALSASELNALIRRTLGAAGTRRGLGGAAGSGTVEDALANNDIVSVMQRNARAIRSLETYLRKLNGENPGG